MKPISEIKWNTGNGRNIVITTHQNPDADALGSSLGLQQYLQLLGYNVTVISSTDFPEFLNWMPGANKIIVLEKNENETLIALQQAEILFCLDFNIHTRTKDLSPHLANFEGTKILIDHHMQPDLEYFDYGTSITSKSSTCEMVYDFIVANGDISKINQSIAECLYAGVMTDTGSFRYDNTTADTHKMIASLIEQGVTPNIIHERIFDTTPETRLRLLGHLLCNNLQIISKKHVAIMHISMQEMNTFDVKNGDTEGMVNYPLSIATINFSTFITEKGTNDIRMSFRSKGDIDVNAFARKYFNGGGHKNAAGGKGLSTLAETLDRFYVAIDEYIN
jgi:bifunctional oligoribonuclease and PAP phosphatase NrnA